MTDAIEKVGSGPLSQVPDFLKGVEGNAGLEKVDQSDLIIPRLMICQALSPQKSRSKPVFIPGLNDGNLFNTVTSEIYGDTVEIIPIVYSRSRIYFKPLKDGGGILCQSFNGIDGGTIAPKCEDCPNSKFGVGEDKAPKCQLFMNFASLLLPSRQLIAASFKSSALKAARGWITRMKMDNRPSFTKVYEIRTSEQQGGKGTFFTPVVNLKRWVTAQEFEFAQGLYDSIKHKTIQTDENSAEEAEDEHVPF